MEYLIIIVLELLGIGFAVMETVSKLNDEYKETWLQILGRYIQQDWDTLIRSFLVLLLNLIAHYIVENYTDLFLNDTYYQLIGFALALILGYAGQRLIYKYFGKAEKFLEKKVDDKLNK